MNFPKHWGDPPEIQTCDIVSLPGGYGMGSSTLAAWIQQRLNLDFAAKVEEHSLENKTSDVDPDRVGWLDTLFVPQKLYKTKTYLIGPMQYKNGQAWREEMTKFLHGMSITVFDPYKKPFVNSPHETPDIHEQLQEKLRAGRYNEVESHMKKVRAYDLSMVDRCDFIICYIDPSVPTFGTMEELVTAVRMKRPCFVVVEGGIENGPLWLLGMLPAKYFYKDFDDLKQMLTLINKGEVEIDSDRWRLLKPELR